MGKDIVEQGFGTELYYSGNILGFRIGVKSSEEVVSTRLPLITAVKSKLRQHSL